METPGKEVIIEEIERVRKKWKKKLPAKTMKQFTLALNHAEQGSLYVQT